MKKLNLRNGLRASLVAQMVKRICLQCRRCGFYPWVGKIPWRRKWLPTSVFLRGESHWQRSLAGYSPWGWKESNTTEQLTHKEWLEVSVLQVCSFLFTELPLSGGYSCQNSSWCLDSIDKDHCPVAAAAAAAKSLQSCPTLYDPIYGSPPGSPVPGILQARTLERVAISFSNAWKWKVKVKSLSCVRLLATPQTAASQAPLSMGCSRQQYWSGLPVPSLFPTWMYPKINLLETDLTHMLSK